MQIPLCSHLFCLTLTRQMDEKQKFEDMNEKERRFFQNLKPAQTPRSPDDSMDSFESGSDEESINFEGLLENIDSVHQKKHEEMLGKLEIAAANLLFEKMSYVCAKAYAEHNITIVGFTEDWFHAAFLSKFEKQMNDDPNDHRMKIPVLTYFVCHFLLDKHINLFKMKMSELGFIILQGLGMTNYDMKKIIFKPKSSFWRNRF